MYVENRTKSPIFTPPVHLTPRWWGSPWNFVSAQGSQKTRMMVLSDGRESFPIGLAVLIQYRSVTATQPATQPASHVAVAITLNAKASSLKTKWHRHTLGGFSNSDVFDVCHVCYLGLCCVWIHSGYVVVCISVISLRMWWTFASFCILLYSISYSQLLHTLTNCSMTFVGWIWVAFAVNVTCIWRFNIH